MQNAWRARTNILTFSVAYGEPFEMRSALKDTPDFRPVAPLTFWPRSTRCESRTTGARVVTVSSYFDEDTFLPEDGDALGPLCVDDYLMIELMKSLKREVTRADSFSLEIVSSISHLLRLKLRRILELRHKPRGDPRQNAMAEVSELILRGDDVTSAGDLGSMLKKSARTIRRNFRKHLGTTPSEYLDDLRIQKAKNLIATTNLSFKQIAHRIGYSRPSSFSAKFKSATGLTPTEFRNAAQVR
jgi:AraC-like DNA-binding protein